ncbi:hypothetical protein HDV62DRAFT_182779 [Trichoderma sp. SZMC 28011]
MRLEAGASCLELGTLLYLYQRYGTRARRLSHFQPPTPNQQQYRSRQLRSCAGLGMSMGFVRSTSTPIRFEHPVPSQLINQLPRGATECGNARWALTTPIGQAAAVGLAVAVRHIRIWLASGQTANISIRTRLQGPFTWQGSGLFC